MAEVPKLLAADFLTLLEHPVTPSYLRFSMFHFINNAFRVIVVLSNACEWSNIDGINSYSNKDSHLGYAFWYDKHAG